MGKAGRPTLLLLAGDACNVVDSDEVQACTQRGATAAQEWQVDLERFEANNPEAFEEISRRFNGKLPDGWTSNLPSYAPGERAQATRQYSAKILASLVTAIPEMIGGSADLTGSNLTNQAQLKDFQPKRPSGRYIRFGVREHAMISICTGLAAYGGFLPFCATFLNFFTYGWGALHLACTLSAHVIYIASHDSIELGEDGPTHQPIEVLPMLRALPNLLTFRPADGAETVGAYEVAVQRSCPSVLALSRSGTPHLEGSSRSLVSKGAYILSNFDPSLTPLVILAASGTEVATCVEAKALLQTVGVGVRVVSMPCWELLEEQGGEYFASLFESSADSLPGVKPLRVYVEASATLGFHRYADLHIGMQTFGASAEGKVLRKHFGFEKNSIASKVMESLRERELVESYRLGRFGFCKFGIAIRSSITQ